MQSGSPAITEIGIADLMKVVETSQNSSKYTLIFDKNGNCDTFFRYKANMVEFHK